MKYFVLFLLFIQTALACEITFPHQIIVLGEAGLNTQIVQAKDCAEAIIKDAVDIASTLEGRISHAQFTDILNQKGYENITIQPSMVQIQQFKNILRDQLMLPTGIQIKATRAVNTAPLMTLTPGDRIEVSCTACLYGMSQTINVSVISFDGSRKNFLAAADFKKMVKAYRLLAPLPAFSEISQQGILREEYIEAIPHTDLVTNIETLKFFKTNKPLRTGEILRSSDLNALNLVKAGLKTDVILENQMIRIKTQGISRSNGSLGETVEVYHPQKNKKYQGRVIDINRVLVEL
jgi:flagella basal body P-ring formation protein FlgA